MKSFFLFCFANLMIVSHFIIGQANLLQEDSLSIPSSAFYAGLGGSFNSINFGDQKIYAIGTAEVYDSGSLILTGDAAGPATIPIDIQTTFSPAVQFGYFKQFEGSHWLWGSKFLYSYLATTASIANVSLPQAGSYTETTPGTTTDFIGVATVAYYNTTINQQMALIPFIGYLIKNGFIYFGAGPSLTQTESKFSNLIGFADIDSAVSDISGPPTDLSTKQWVFGAGGILGTTYFIDKSWFLDFSYSYFITSNKTSNYFQTFSNNNSNGSITNGTLSGTNSYQVSTQTFTIFINKTF